MGRIIRENDNITAIVEHKDATDAQREIKEINTGMMMMSGVDLKRWLGELSNDNAQGGITLPTLLPWQRPKASESVSTATVCGRSGRR